jgi:monovalent cation/hydrogen antiporter
MTIFELAIALLFVGALLAAAARRMNAPYPAMLALAGAAIALLPSAPRVALDPELALTLFVAPVLLDAAYDSSPRDLRRNWRAVTGLALVAVGLTVAAVAIAVRALVPDIPWAAAVALGAIVAPPDAAAATAVLRQLHPPHRVLVILEGESLFNDATALLTYRLAVAAAVTGTVSGWAAAPMLVAVCAGSVLLGLALSWLSVRLLPRVEDVATAVLLQFLSTFAVWMLAERLHLSGIITMVVYAIRVARTAPINVPARIRIPSYAVWEVVVFVLNVLAFILIGLQLEPIVSRQGRAELTGYAVTIAAVLAAVIAVRFAWVLGYTVVVRAARWVRGRIRGGARGEAEPSFRAAAVIAWCGMRGIVTLAAALALPDGTHGVPAFPHRDLVVATAFGVVLGTLVLQGLTVSPLMRLLRLEDDGSVERESRLARAETARAALEAIGAAGEAPETVELLRRKYEARLQAASAPAGSSAPIYEEQAALASLQRSIQSVQRRALFDLRARGAIGDDAFHRVEEELDWGDVNLAVHSRRD